MFCERNWLESLTLLLRFVQARLSVVMDCLIRISTVSVCMQRARFWTIHQKSSFICLTHQHHPASTFTSNIEHFHQECTYLNVQVFVCNYIESQPLNQPLHLRLVRPLATGRALSSLQRGLDGGRCPGAAT